MPWEAGHRSQHVLARRLTEYEYDPRLSEVPGFVSAALQG
jgi:hypothetical protein